MILVTGGAGFIGTNLVRGLVEGGEEVVVVDRLGYAARRANLDGLGGVRLIVCDLATPGAEIPALLESIRPTAVIHCAAETHVDRSIADPSPFVTNNLVATFRLLEAVRGYWRALSDEARHAFRFLHVSTDEVYGSRAPHERPNREGDPYDPSSPYAATKAGADHLVKSWHRTYGLPILVTHCTNNYGPYQHPEKFLPLMIYQALQGRPLPVYGDGRQVRDWLYVGDHVRALLRVLEAGEIGATYHVSADHAPTNLDVLERLCALLDRLRPRPEGSYGRLIRHIPDRPGHDRRYALDSTRLRTTLGWRPQVSLEEGLERTVGWYLEQTAWWGDMAGEQFQHWLRTHYPPEIAA